LAADDYIVKPQFSAQFTNVWDEQAVTWDVKGSPARRGLDVTVSALGPALRKESAMPNYVCEVQWGTDRFSDQTEERFEGNVLGNMHCAYFYFYFLFLLRRVLPSLGRY